MAKILDLFCGAGGAAMGYHQAGFEVVGVDIRKQPNYPFTFVQADALEIMRAFLDLGPWPGNEIVEALEIIDGIHASPPCQRFSSSTRHPGTHPDLITPLRPLLQQTSLPYVIENVPNAPLFGTVQLCGSTFGLKVRRHRWFECNFPVEKLRCMHWEQETEKPFILQRSGRWFRSSIVEVAGHGTPSGKGGEFWPWAMGCGETWTDCWMTPWELKEAVPPAYTNYIGRQLLIHMDAQLRSESVA